MDKTEALNSLRSQLFADFRTGLKLPHLDTSKPYHMDDPAPQPVNTPKLISSPRKALNKSHIVGNKDINGAGDSFKVRSLASEPSLSQEPSLSSIRGVTITPKPKSHGGGDQVENEINQRISSVYRSIESLEKKRQHFDNSLRAAARRTVADIEKNKAVKSKPSTAKNTAPKLPVDIPKVAPPIRKPSRIIDVTRTYPKMFGLDPMKVIASSEDESADEGEENKSKKGVRKPKKSIRKYLELLVQEDEPRDMSAIMPSLSEKTFLTKLQKRETQLNKEINDMRVNLDVMHMKADREAKKGKVEMRHPKAGTVFGKSSNITRLLHDDPDKGPSRELTEFLQATGGPTGGWEAGDHQLFVRGYQKWSTNPALLVENISRLLPNKKPEDVVEHATWYEKYEKLKNASRSHIRKWELNKRKEREIVFRMANQSNRAEMEKEKYHQDLIKAKRAEELQREHEALQNWKRSKAQRSARKLVPSSDEPATDTGLRISKMDLDMSEMRKEIREITAMTKDIGKSLRSLDISDHVHKPHNKEGHHRERVSTGSDASSGFCEMTMDDIEAVSHDLEGDGEKFLRKTVRVVSANIPNRDMNTHAESNKKLLEDFRARDVEMVTAKKKAIENRKKKMRNKAFLTDSQIKDRMKKIKAPSKLSEPTKGWMIRNEIRELEKIESQNRLNSARKEVTDSFAPVTHVSNIPKLGTPFWRKIS